MRNFLLRMLLIAALVVPWATPGGSSLMAQNEVTIGTGTSTGYSVPFTNFYNHGRAEMLYTAEELGGVPSYINSVAFQVSAGGSLSPESYTVYMGTTDNTTLSSWIAGSALTQVATFADPTFTSGTWYTIELAEPYFWDGSGSLVVDVTHTGSGYSSSVKFYYGGSSDMCRYRNSDSDASYASVDNSSTSGTTNGRPNTKFSLTPAGGNFCYKPAGLQVTPNYSNLSVHAMWSNPHAGPSTYYTAYLCDATGRLDSVTCEPYDTTADFAGPLATNVEYHIEVVSNCSSDNISQPATSSAFAFLAAPYTQDFNNCTGLPTGWTVLSYGSPSVSTGGRTGKCLYQYGNGYTVALPRLVSNLQDLQLSFWSKTTSTSYNGTVTVGVVSALAEDPEYDTLAVFPLNTSWEQHVVYLALSPITTGYIVLDYHGSSSDMYSYVDDVEVTEAPSCLPVANLVANPSANSIEISWTALGEPAAFLIDYDTVGFDMEAVHHTATVTDNTFTAEDLEANKEYDFYVRAICGDGDTAEMVGPFTVKTRCLTLTVADLPYTETFEGSANMPSCWTLSDLQLGSGSNYPWTITSGAHSGSRCMHVQDQNATARHLAATNAVEIGDNDQIQVSFWVKRAGATSYNTKQYEGVRVWASPSATDTVGGVVLAYIHRSCANAPAEAGEGWYQYETEAIPMTGTVYILFEGINEYGGDTPVDDVVIRRIPTCKKVTDVHQIEQSATSATIAWSYPLENAASYTVVYGPVATFDPDDPTTVLGEYTTPDNDTVFTIPNLDELTSYKVAVRANCTDETYGEWSNSASILTSMDCGDQSYRNVVIGSGTTTSYYAPVYSFYNTVANMAIYKSTELEAQDVFPGQIKSISYQMGSGASVILPVKIYMGHTTRNSFSSAADSVPLSQMDLVYEGGITLLADNWCDIRLDNPFDYNSANGNLVVRMIVTGDTTLLAGSGDYKGYYTSVSGSVLYRTTGSYYTSSNRPNIRLSMCVTEPDCFSMKSANFVIATPTTATLAYTEDARNAERGLTTGHMVYAVVDDGSADAFDPFNPTGNYVSELCQDGDTMTINNRLMTSLTVNGLSPNTPYVFFVVAQCDASTGLQYAECEGRTSCGAWDLPFTTTFDGNEVGSGNFNVYCWQQSSTIANTPKVATNSGRSGNGMTFDVQGSGAAYQNTIAILPEVVETYEMNQVQISFWAKKSAEAAEGLLQIGVMSDPADTNTFELVGTVEVATTSFDEYKFNLTDYEGEGRFVALKVGNNSAAGSYTLTLDDVTLREKPLCEKPIELAAAEEEISSNDIPLTWTDDENTDPQYQVVYKVMANFNEAYAMEFNADTNTYLYDMVDVSDGDEREGFSFAAHDVELRQGTIYAIAVRAVCGTNYSMWSNPIVATTGCAPISYADMPWTENFDGVITYSENGYQGPQGYSGRESLDHVFYCFDFPGISSSRNTAPLAFASQNGDGYALTLSATNAAPSVVVLPEFTTEMAGLQITFDYKAANGTLEIGVYNDDEFTVLDTLTNVGNIITVDHLFSTDDVAFAEDARIAFRYTGMTSSMSTSNTATIDNIVVSEGATCAKPTDLVMYALVGPSAYSIPLKWKNGTVGDASAWEIQYVHQELTAYGYQPVVETVSVTNVVPNEAGIVSYTLTGLLANTEYTIHVRSNCGEENGYSEWSNDSVVCSTKSDATYIASFSLYNAGQQIGAAVIDSVNHTVTVNVVYGVDYSSVRARMSVSDGATAKIDGVSGFDWSNSNNYNYEGGLQVYVVSADPSIYQMWTIYLVTEPCTTPTALTFQDVERRSFTAVWTNLDPTATTHELLYSVEPLTEAELDQNEPIVVEGTNSYTFTREEGIVRDTKYYIYVRANCGDNASRWIMGTVKTLNLGYFNCDETLVDTIGTGTSTSSYVPAYSYFNYSYSQQIWKKSELLPTTIKKMTFQCSATAGDGSPRQVQIYLSTTPDSTLNNGWLTLTEENSTLVYQGPMGGSIGNEEITLDQPYMYEGNANLCMTVVYNLTGIGYSMGLAYKGTNLFSGACRYEYNDNYLYDFDYQPGEDYEDGTVSNFRMNVMFEHCGLDEACPQVRDLDVAYNNDDPTQVVLHWASDGDYASEYQIIIDTMQLTNEQLEAMPESSIQTVFDATSYTLQNLQPYTMYYLYIRVKCNGEGQDDGSSTWNSIPFRTNAACRAPKNLAVEFTGKNTAVVSWEADEVQEANYRYIRSTTPVPDPDHYNVTASGLNVTSLTLNNLINDQHYYVYVSNSCGGEDGNSPYELIEFDMVPACPAPINIRLSSLQPTGVTVDWKSDTNLFASESQWQVTWYAIDSLGNQLGDSRSLVADMPNAVVTYLQPETQYKLEIRSVCDGTPGINAATATFTTPVQIDCVTIGTGTGTNTYSFPISMYYHYSYTQQLFKAEEIGGTAGTIRSIAFNYTSTATTTRQVRVFLGNTDQNSLSSEFISINGMTEVLPDQVYDFENDGSNFANIDLVTPFEYTGGNILVTVLMTECDEETQYGGNYYFPVQTLTSGISRYAQDDNNAITLSNGMPSSSGSYSSYRNNVKFCFEAGDCPKVSHVVATPESHTAHVSWYVGGSETSWNVMMSEEELSDSVLNAGAGQLTVTNPYVDFDGLEIDHTYNVYIRAICSAENSGWAHTSFITLPSCSAPSIKNFMVSDDTVFCVVAHDGEYGSASTFEYQFFNTDVEDAEPISVIGGDSIAYTGLPHLANYTWRVRSICGDGDTSRFTEGEAFHICGSITDLPYLEEFDDASTLACLFPAGSAPSIYTSGYASFDAFGSYNMRAIIFPEVAEPLSNLMVTFNAKQYSSSHYGQVKLYALSVNGSAIEDLQELTTIELRSTEYEDYEVYLDQFGEITGNRIMFSVEKVGSSENWVYLENFGLNYIPDCRRPSAFRLAGTQVNAHSVDLTWEQPGSAMAWIITDTLTGQTYQIPYAAATVTGSQVSVNLGGLTANTDYAFRVSAVCDNSNSELSLNTVKVRTLSDEASFTSYAVNGMVGNALIDAENHVIEVTVRADVDVREIVSTFRVNSGAKVLDAAGNEIVSGDNLMDYTYGQFVYLQPACQDVEATEWEIRVMTEGCASLYGFAAANVTRVALDLTFNTADSNVNTFYLIYDTVAMTAEELATAEYQVINVEGEGVARTYHVEGLEREHTYHFYLRNECNPAWLHIAATTKALTYCEPYQIGNGTGTNENLPYYSLWNFGYSQQIFDKEEIPAGPITGFAIQSAAVKDRKVDIYLGTTTKSTFTGTSDFVPGSALTLVAHNVHMGTTTGWNTFTFDEPFMYDGNSNLVVAINNVNGSYSSGASFYVTPCTGNKSVYVYRDDTPFTPGNAASSGASGNVLSERNNIRFTICADAEACETVTEIAASNVTASSATLEWTASTSDYVGGYNVYVSDTAVEDFSTIDSLDTYTYTGEAATCELTGLDPEVRYYVYVRTICNAYGHDEGNSVWAPYEFTTYADCRSVENIAAEITSPTTATVSWTFFEGMEGNFAYILSDAEIDDVDLEAVTEDDYQESDITETSIELEDLAPETEYFVYVANICDNGRSSWKAVNFTMPVACAVPVNLTASGTTAIATTLNWDRGQFGEEESWRVIWTYGAEEDSAANSQMMTVNSTTAVVPFPVNDVDYRIYVSAICDESFSNAASITVHAPFQGEGGGCETVGDGTTTISGAPANTSWGNTYSQQIFTVEEMNEKDFYGGVIESIAFNWTASASFDKDIYFYMGHTDMDAFTGSSAANFVPLTDLTLVAGPVTRASGDPAGEQTFTLSEPFAWNGVQNLVIAAIVEQPDGTDQTSSSGYATVGTNTNIYQTAYRYQDHTQINKADPTSATNGAYVKGHANVKFCFAANDGCSRITKAVVSNITENSARVDWYPSDPGNMDYNYVISNVPLTIEDIAASDIQPVNGLGVDLEDLDPDMDFYFYVAPTCAGTDDINLWNTLTFATLPICNQPVAAVATIREDMGVVNFNVTPAEGTAPASYVYEIWSANMDTLTLEGSSSENYALEDLMPVEAIHWRVRAVCDEEGENLSRWTVGNDFHFCGLVSLPYAEGFESYEGYTYSEDADAINCWKTYSTGTVRPHVIGSGNYYYKHTGSKAMTFYGSGYNYAAMPKVNADINTLRMKFWRQMENSSYGTLVVGYIKEGDNNFNTFTQIQQVSSKSGSMGEVTIDLSEVSEEADRLAFRWYYSNQYSCCIDDIRLYVPQNYQVTLNSNDDELGTVEGAGEYAEDSYAEIEAVATLGNHFVQWSDDNTNAHRNILVSQDTTLTAYFEADSYVVYVTSNDTVMGTATSSYDEAGYGALVDIEATANEHAYFVMWSDGDSNAARTLEITNDTYLTAIFAKDSFEVMAESGFETEKIWGLGMYGYADSAVLYAPNVYGYQFQGWSNGETENEIGFRVYDNVYLTANYVPDTFAIVTVAEPANAGTITGAGRYAYETEITLTATPAEGFFFNGWSDGEINAERTYTVLADDSLVANFTEEASYTVNALANNDDFGYTTGSGIYNPGDTAILTAVPFTGYHFTGWADGDTNRIRSVVVSQNADYTANFEINTYNVSIAYASQGFANMGAISIQDVEGLTMTATYGTEIVLNANAFIGNHFDGWSDGNRDTARLIFVDRDIDLTASFAPNQYVIALNVTPMGAGIVNGDTTLNYNAPYTISTVANHGYVFQMWSDSNVNMTRSGQLTEDIYLTAIYTKDTFHVAVSSADLAMGSVTGEADVAFNEYASIRATANAGYQFSSWSDGVTTASRRVLVQGDTTLVANFVPRQYTITVLSQNNSMGTVTGTGSYAYLSNAEMSATPRAGFAFVMWADSVIDNPRTVQVEGPATYTAIFEPVEGTFTVTLAANDATMGTVTGAGEYAVNSFANIEAVPNTNFRFVNWSDNSTEAARRLRVTRDTMLTAIFQPDTHTLNVVSNNAAQGTVTGGGQFVYGTEITIEATPAFGYHFSYWSGNIHENPYTFEFSSAREFYMAYFAPDTFTVNVAINNPAYGTVSGTGRYLYNRTINISATDTNLNDNYVFARWSDGNTDNPRVLTITGDQDITAIFEEANTNYTITVEANVAERGTVAGSGTFTIGAVDTISATANEGFEFVQWQDGNTANPRAITVGGDATFIAQFDSVSYNVTLTADAKMGTVEGAGRYVRGRQATISATCTKAGYHFFGWNDGNNENPRVITVNSDITLGAIFAIDTLTVTANVNDPAMGTITGLTADGRYTYGSYLTVVANAAFGYEFRNWNDGSTNNIYQTIVTEDLNLEATFGLRQYTITAGAEYAERGAVEGAGSYDYMSNATLTAVANYGYHFVQWLDGETSATRTVVVNGPNSYIAQFDPNMYTVSAIVDETKATYTIENAQTPYLETAVISVEPLFGYIFNGWSDGNMSNPRTITVTCDTVLTANFVADSFDIEVVSADETIGTVTGSGRYAYGDTVQITAAPLDPVQNQFYYWNDNDTNAVRDIVVLGNATYTATFGTHAYRVLVFADHGTYTQTNNGIFNAGDNDTIHITADYGYVFTGWADGNTDSVRVIENITSDMTLTANFAKANFDVVVNAGEHGTANGSGSYEYESFATLTATADAHYHFTNWSDGATDNPYNYQVLGNATITANFAIDTLTVTAVANDAAMGTVTGAGRYIYGLAATLTATANYGYKFVSWSNGDVVNPLSFYVTSDTALTAIFAVDQFDINVACNETEGTVTGAGSYDYGSNAVIEAVANYGYHFTQWNDGNTDNPRTIQVTTDQNFVASFARNNYTLTVSVDSTEMGSVTGAGSYAFEEEATITAVPNHGYHFTQWSDGDTNATRTVVVTRDSAFTAQFARNLYTITTTVNDETLGTVTGGGEYLFGAQVVLHAVPADATVEFTNWGDASTENPRTITVTDNATYRANFQRNLQTFTVTLNVNDEAMGTVNGAGSYTEGTTATISAVANEHYEFDSWSDGNTSATRQIVVNSNITLTANFVAMNYMITVTCDETMGTVSGGGSYAYNTTATLTATAKAGYEFVQWSDGNTNATRTVTVQGDAQYVAEFRAVQGIDDVDALNVTIYSTNGNIVVKGAANQSIYIYDAVGRCVNHVANNYSEVNEFAMPTSGVYMVKVGNLPARRVVVVR